MRLKTVFLVNILLVFMAATPAFIHTFAQVDCSDTKECSDLIDKYQQKINKLKGQANTLQNEIDYMDSQMAITELKIQTSLANIRTTEKKISQLATDINDLGLRITKLQASISHQTNILDARMRERYKDKDDSFFMILFGGGTLNQIIKKTEYLKIMELNDTKLIKDMGSTKNAFESQKTLFEQSKTEQEKLKTQLVTEKANLDSYKVALQKQQASKKTLLEQTQNDEQKYQKLLAEAQSQLDSFRGFTSTAGGGAIASNGFGKGDLGWYYSQRDARWATKTIGDSNESILNVGCLVTSVAMVYKSHGKDVDPLDIARRDIYFSNTAYMIVPSDFKVYTGSYAGLASTIDGQLSKGRPVIVGLKTGPYGTHFVVFAKKVSGFYIMYDPWYGPDLKLTSHYSTSAIYSAVTY